MIETAESPAMTWAVRDAQHARVNRDARATPEFVETE